MRDIVERLRRVEYEVALCDEAAEEIERLRDILGRSQEEAGELLHAKANLHSQIKRLELLQYQTQGRLTLLATANTELRAEIAKLRDILASIKWRSCEKDNMEFSAKITCFQKDKIDAALQKDEGE